MKNNKNINFISESNAPKLNYVLTLLIPIILCSIYTLYTAHYYFKGMISENQMILTYILSFIIPIAVIMINFFFDQFIIKPSFVFNDHEITRVNYPPLIYDELLFVETNHNEIKSINKVNDMKQCNIHISYKFTALTLSNRYAILLPNGYFADTPENQSYIHNPIKFNINVYKNHEIIYEKDVEYFEKIYFSNPYNRRINMNNFIKTAINDGLDVLLNTCDLFTK